MALARVVKRRAKVIGTLKTPEGEVGITNPIVARALLETDQLRKVLHQANNTMTRQRDIISERNLSLASLQNHWWTRLGNLLRIVREDAHARKEPDAQAAGDREAAHAQAADPEAAAP